MMTFKYRERVRETSVTTGAGDLSLAGTVDSSYSTFASVMSDGDTTDARIILGSAWESCPVTFNASAGTLTRGTPYESTNSGAAVSFGAGTKDIIMELPAFKAQMIPRCGDLGISFDSSVPDRCAELDGSTITGGAATYPFVAARYPWMVSSGNLNLPDLRGNFLRSWAHGSSNDPDKATRTARVGDAQTGDYPGTIQADGFKSHTHPLPTDAIYNVGGGAWSGGGQGNIASRSSSATGGNETRPLNTNVMFYMRMG
jgi:hypothetical protein